MSHERARQRNRKLRRLALYAGLAYVAVSKVLDYQQAQIAEKESQSLNQHMRENGLFIPLPDSLVEKNLTDAFSGDNDPFQPDTTYRQYDGFLRGDARDQRKMKKVTDRMSKSDEGKALIDSLKKWGVSLSLDSLGPYGGLYEGKDVKHIWLNEAQFTADMVSTAAHEGTHARQDHIGKQTSHANMSLQESMALTRFYEADACAHAALVAWQLKEKGDPNVFTMYQSSPLYGHICSAIKKESRKNFFRPLSDKEVLQTAFEAWFENAALRDGYDKQSMFMNAKAVLMQSDSAVRAHYTDTTDFAKRIQGLCVETSSGKPYLDDIDKYMEPNSIYMGQRDPYMTAGCVDFLSRRVDSIQNMSKQDTLPADVPSFEEEETKENKKQRLEFHKNRYREQTKTIPKKKQLPLVRRYAGQVR